MSAAFGGDGDEHRYGPSPVYEVFLVFRIDFDWMENSFARSKQLLGFAVTEEQAKKFVAAEQAKATPYVCYDKATYPQFEVVRTGPVGHFKPVSVADRF